MKHPSLYLEWYVRVPKIKHDLRSSGLSHFRSNAALGEVDLSLNYARGNPEVTKVLASRYRVRSENVFVSSEGTSGQNARIIRLLAEKTEKKNEAIVEYLTYEPLLRQAQENFSCVRRLNRKQKEAYTLDADKLRKIVSEKTRLLVLTNPHAPSGAISSVSELKEIMAIAQEYDFYVLCDEIYAEFNRDAVPTVFSIDPNLGIVTTSFTKAYGLGGLRIGIAIAKEELVDDLYVDTLNTVGVSSNIVNVLTIKLLTEGKEDLERHKQKWIGLKKETEKWLSEKSFEYFSNEVGITFWMKLQVEDTYRWVNEHAIPRYSLVVVPGTFFLFEAGYKLTTSNMIRLGLGNLNPDDQSLAEALDALEKAQNV